MESRGPKRHILYVDAYDSFSNNVTSMLEEHLDISVTVLTVDSEWPDGSRRKFLRQFDAVVLGPGPGNPECPTDVGIMRELWTLEGEDIVPVLGICLGFQSMCLHHGVPVRRLPTPLHGQVFQIDVEDEDIFAGMDRFECTLYHSLYASLDDNDTKVEALSFLAWLSLVDDRSVRLRIPMAARHRTKPYWGFQFHPESCKSDAKSCRELLRRWWNATLEFNKRSGRMTSGRIATSLPPPSSLLAHPMLQNMLEELTISSSTTCAYRSLPLQDLSTEKIFELANLPQSQAVLFQSNGRFNILSVLCSDSWRLEYRVPDTTLRIYEALQEGSPRCQQIVVPVESFWDALRHVMTKRRVTQGKGDVPFWGGFLGYFSYEMGLAGLAHPKTFVPPFVPQDSHSQAPDVSLLWVERSIVVDNTARVIYIQSTRETDDFRGGWLDTTLQRIQDLSSALSQDMSKVALNKNSVDIGPQSILTPAERVLIDGLLKGSTVSVPDAAFYKAQIEQCQAELHAGESYELCLTGQTTVTVPAVSDKTLRHLRPWLLYKKLKTYNPAAFSAYARLGHVKIASSSPECFLNWDRTSTLEMKPMKGTVRKASGMTLDKARAILLGSTKEVGENLMIADLIRHDLYGICGSGNVHVEKLLEVEDHGRVYQMITHVKGRVPNGSSSSSSHGITALQRCLPPGSMTGAPKERSCMHLQRIEARSRGIYSGVMGYLDLGGAGSFSVLIRTASTCYNDDDSGDRPETWTLGAGGAVTVLSTPDGEWEEMQTKLRTVVNVFQE
ncbi:hypothetical protein VTN31DRAFT_5790 [Thermomyces dupontii]|uniref:uncharacterized protein n=1 Tax=Talaromyces thermophilus TaxID=28565 RepID=UPI003742890D